MAGPGLVTENRPAERFVAVLSQVCDGGRGAGRRVSRERGSVTVRTGPPGRDRVPAAACP